MHRGVLGSLVTTLADEIGQARLGKELTGRIVRVVTPGLGNALALVQHFHVAIDDDDASIAAVRQSQSLSADQRVEAIAELAPAVVVALLLRPGQVKIALTSPPASRCLPGDPI
jgi:hypothetical protein